MNLSKEELHILQHTLGLDEYGEGNRYRNYYAIYPESSSRVIIDGLVQRGLMAGYMESDFSELLYYHVTDRGEESIALNSPVRPKISRSKQRYQDYLKSEVDESFGWWLKNRC